VCKGKKGKRKGKWKGKRGDNNKEWAFINVNVDGVSGNVNEDVKKKDVNVVVVVDKDKDSDIKKKHNKTQKKHLNNKPIINSYNQYDYDDEYEYEYDEYDYCDRNLNLHNLKYGIPQHTYDDSSLENSQLQEAIRRSIYQQ
jgi:hypothetical protein